MNLTEEELELFEIAFLLKLPLYRLLDEMSYQELEGWFAYLKQRPPGWREDYRTSLQLAAAGVKMKGSELFPSLAMLDSKRTNNKIEASAMGFFIKKAVGGDKVGFS